MQVSTVIAIYFLIWWVTLFVVLPFGVKSQHEDGEFAEGTDPGAPVLARVGIKLLWTTIIATGIFGLFYLLHAFRIVDFVGLMTWVRPQ